MLVWVNKSKNKVSELLFRSTVGFLNSQKVSQDSVFTSWKKKKKKEEKNQASLNAISWAAPAHERGAWLLQKPDPAMGPLKEYGMSLLNGAQSEKSAAPTGETHTSNGRTGATGRHETLTQREMNEEWERTESRRAGGEVMSWINDELTRRKVSESGESRLRGEERGRETTESQGKDAVRQSGLSLKHWV